jgi:CDP-glycerol glycerophosphotransferase
MLLTFVVAVHRHQAWVRPFLRSVLDSARETSPSDVEVIVVDDASPDHTAEIVDEVAATDARVRRHRHSTRAGTSASWRTGVELAAGEHVWLLDAEDLVLPVAVPAVLAGLAGRPDVLLVPGVDLDLFGGRRPAAAPGTAPLLRDRVLRREHVLAVPPPRGGELGRVTWATAALARATSVDRLSEPVWAHRRLPVAVRRQWSDSDPWDVFAAYDDAFDELAAHGTPAAVAELASAMIAEQHAMLDVVLPADRQRFVGRAALSVAVHGAGIRKPSGFVARLERRGLTAGSYRVIRLVARLRRTGRMARSLPRWVPRNRRAAEARLRGLRYAAHRRRPLDPDLVAFSAYWGQAFSCNPRAIYLRMRELRPHLRGVWVVKAGSEHLLPAGVPHVLEGSDAYYSLMARATYLVNNVNFPNDVVKRPGQVHLQTHHGTPLKTMGLDLVHAAHTSLGLNFRRLMKRVERWDYSISANPFSTEVWERVYPSGTYVSIETGYPRNDELALATDAEKMRVRAVLGIGENQCVLLYTPTHREYTKHYVPLLDPVRLAEHLGADWTILVRGHYFYRDVAAGEHARVVDVAAYPSIEELSIASDLLVTDYSSLMFDYAVLDRPIVIYAPDWDEYRTQRGTNFDLMAEPPGAVATSQDELTDLLRSGRYDDDASTRLRVAFRERFTTLEDGRAAERVVRRLWPVPSAD